MRSSSSARQASESRAQSSRVGGALLGELGERLPDRGERDADALRGPDERDPAQRVPGVAALVARGAAAADQALGLVEVQGGDGGAAAGGRAGRP